MSYSMNGVQGFAGIKKALDEAEQKARQRVVDGLNRAAEKTRQDVVQMMPNVFDRPTQYTLRSLYVRRAVIKKHEGDMSASVFFKSVGAPGGKTPAAKYLMPSVLGTKREHKRFETRLVQAGVLQSGYIAVPAAGADLDFHGNVRRQQMGQVVSLIKGGLAKGIRNREKRSNKKKGQYFVVGVGQGQNPGIYLRKGGEAVPVFLFVRHSGLYEKRFPFYAIVSERAFFHARRELPP